MGAPVSARPLIGLTTSEVRSAGRSTPTPEGEPVSCELALGVEYVRAIDAAGGAPMILPALDHAAVDALLEPLCALCLTGGPDVHPLAYGAREDSMLGPTWPEIDRFELALARGADARGLPILAICRGAQVLNVARGGTLFQHLPDRPGSLPHRQSARGSATSHRVSFAVGSVAETILGRDLLDVNSFHHQAVDRLGSGLRATAWADDGVIEAIEAEDRDFVIGVQWHAESLADRPEEGALFGALVAWARRFTRTASRRRAA